MTTCLAPPPDKPKEHKDWQFGIILALDAPRRTDRNLGDPEEDSEVIDRVLGHHSYAGEARLEAQRIIIQKLHQTEANEEFYWSYDVDGDTCLHRKFAGVLTREDFEAPAGGLLRCKPMKSPAPIGEALDRPLSETPPFAQSCREPCAGADLPERNLRCDERPCMLGAMPAACGRHFAPGGLARAVGQCASWTALHPGRPSGSKTSWPQPSSETQGNPRRSHHQNRAHYKEI